jgi:hypothetical protein
MPPHPLAKSMPINKRKFLVHYSTCEKTTYIRLQKRLGSWKCKMLSLGGRLILINAVLTNKVLYMISFFIWPKSVLHKLDYYRSRFFYQGNSEKNYRLVKWSVICRPRDMGGLGVHDFEVKNSALFGKWLYALLTEVGVW